MHRSMCLRVCFKHAAYMHASLRGPTASAASPPVAAAAAAATRCRTRRTSSQWTGKARLPSHHPRSVDWEGAASLPSPKVSQFTVVSEAMASTAAFCLLHPWHPFAFPSAQAAAASRCRAWCTRPSIVEAFNPKATPAPAVLAALPPEIAAEVCTRGAAPGPAYASLPSPPPAGVCRSCAVCRCPCRPVLARLWQRRRE